ncbi:MAG: flagellar protein FlgN [Lachnospiraceae bacterium]|nr:flagellar protein FlgN [Lachnospiraceae bacterium]MCR5410114.1 flagellar protein FlgN [Lachnospiraceae bacterium]
MASLIEVLIDALTKEESEYVTLLDLSKKKTPIIIAGEIEKLQTVTDEEQSVVDRLIALDIKRAEAMKDIAEVMNRDVGTLKLSHLIEMLENRPSERDAMIELRDRLKATVGELKIINDQNRELIRQSLDIVDFNLNLIKSQRSAPETSNYNRSAGIAGSALGGSTGGFDAKQ